MMKKIWLMRQSGRYIPDYMQLRKQEPDFIAFCKNPQLVTEATLIPFRYFNLDYAIIFSDILVILDAIGLKVEFLKDHGPQVTGFTIERLPEFKSAAYQQRLKPIYEGVSSIRHHLPKSIPLIGFSACPFTLLYYAFYQQTKGHKNADSLLQALYQNPNYLLFIDLLVDIIIDYLSQQIELGCTVLQLFDSWAGFLPYGLLNDYCFKPTQVIVQTLKQRYPQVEIIAFPKGIGQSIIEFVHIVKPDVISFDSHYTAQFMLNLTRESGVKGQGNMDHNLLVVGGKPMYNYLDYLLSTLGDVNWIYNLGHGIVPQTPIQHVQDYIRYIHQYKG